MSNTLNKKQAKKVAEISAKAETDWTKFSQDSINPAFIKKEKTSNK